MSNKNTNEITLDDLSSHEKFVLRLIGDKPKEKHVGLSSTTPNYLTSIGLVKYCGGGIYDLTPDGLKLYLERELFFKNNTQKQEIEENKILLIN
jgi:hypothetical protein